MLVAVATLTWSAATCASQYVYSVFNTVHSAIYPTKTTFDPRDALRVGGWIIKGTEAELRPCESNGPLPQQDIIQMYVDVDPGQYSTGQQFCFGTYSNDLQLSNPFLFGWPGGGVSWKHNQNPATGLGTYVMIEAREANHFWVLVCGDRVEYPQLPGPGCGSGPNGSASPEIYGQVGSPDLNGDLRVDQADLDNFGLNYLGHTVTTSNGTNLNYWQADFNDSGYVDSGDVAYLAGRVGACCGAGCVEAKTSVGNDYAMRIENLLDDGVQRFLQQSGVVSLEVLRLWDEMGLSWDRTKVQQIASASHTAGLTWSEAKQLYRSVQ